MKTMTHKTLARDLCAILEKAQQAAKKKVAQVLVNAYWDIGKRLHQAGVTIEAGKSASSLRVLADQTDIPYHTLQRSLNFYQQYPKGCPKDHLTWSHYRALLAVKDADQRERYRVLAIDQGVASHKMVDLIKEHMNQGQALARPTEPTYVYKAIVENVVDGDTLVVRIDLGFTVWKELRLRLAGVNTPERGMPGADEATSFVQRALSDVDFIMIKTNAIDIYGRYVAHVFYLPGSTDKVKVFTEGRYLNAELLQAGHAVRV